MLVRDCSISPGFAPNTQRAAAADQRIDASLPRCCWRSGLQLGRDARLAEARLIGFAFGSVERIHFHFGLNSSRRSRTKP
jgi:hypothetical protein